ncbi:NACHT-ANK domain protein transcript variant 3 [Tuber magnatum]|uniref:NACHT-ANK domain protein transcript variant 3 n=1 Tax=Tuber magnatum TaxID=42249 RepID=A0A317SKE5_9PEZI|nr:NACHT-ANK domain protein transcript variant 3 [Tuber magnatum]
MDDQQSSTRSEGLPSTQRGNSGSHIFGSGNTTHAYYDPGAHSTSQRQADILQFLYTSRYEEHRDRVRKPVEGTCTWVTKHPRYQEWLVDRRSGLLWLSADPGCGKSVIASFLVNHLRAHTDAIVCFFFFKDDNDEQKSATFALCAILHQIFKERPHLTKFAEEEFRAKGKAFTREVNALWSILVKAVAEGGCGNVICVVDALDECEERTLDQFIRRVTSLAGSHTPDIPLKFLFTSRPYLRIDRDLGLPKTTIRLRGEEEMSSIATDVTRVIDEGIESLESNWGLPGGLGYLRNLLESSADRTFLWVSLTLEILKDCDDYSQEEFTKILTRQGGDLAELYTKMLDKIKSPNQARRILSIVVAATRPLTLREMNAAVRIKREHRSSRELGDMPAGFEKIVKNRCGLFVRVIDSKIYLIHQTAREFLVKGSLPGRGNWQYTFCPMDTNVLLADICTSYLSLEDFENDPLVAHPNDHSGGAEFAAYVEKYVLLDYAASHWADNFRDAGDRQMELFESTRLICEGGSNRFLTWFRVYWKSSGQKSPFPKEFTHLMIASWFGQGRVVARVSEKGGTRNALSKQYGTALNIAAFRRNKDVTRMLLERNVNAYIARKEYNILHVRSPHGLKWLVLN